MSTTVQATDEIEVQETDKETIYIVDNKKHTHKKDSTEQSKNGQSKNSKKTRKSQMETMEKELEHVIYGDDYDVVYRRFSGDSPLPQEIIEPPLKFHIWAKVPQINSRVGRCIRTYATNVVRAGVKFVPKKPITDDTPEETKREVEAEIERLEEFFDGCNKKNPFSEILYLMKVDVETIGNGYLEFIENNGGDLTTINHAPGVNIYILRGGRGYVQDDCGDKTYFKPFGITDDEVQEKFGDGVKNVMDSRTGLYVGEKKKDGNLQEPPPIEYRATSLQHFALHTTTSTVYGEPRYVSAGLAIAGNYEADQRNVYFFKNDTVGRVAIIVTGGKLTEESMEDIRRFMEAGQGAENSHRCMILHADPEEVGGVFDENKQRIHIEIKPLTVGLNEDASFLHYRSANNEEVRECFGLAQIFFTSTDTNKASAKVGKEITDEQEFEPERKVYEHILNHGLMKHPTLKVKHTKMVFIRKLLSDPAEKNETFSSLTTQAAITPNEIREEMGKPPFPDAYNFGKKPLLISMREFEAGLSLLTAIQQGGEAPQPPLPEPEQQNPLAKSNSRNMKDMVAKIQGNLLKSYQSKNSKYAEDVFRMINMIGENPQNAEAILKDMIDGRIK